MVEPRSEIGKVEGEGEDYDKKGYFEEDSERRRAILFFCP
jgi:hypothetical protein